MNENLRDNPLPVTDSIERTVRDGQDASATGPVDEAEMRMRRALGLAGNAQGSATRRETGGQVPHHRPSGGTDRPTRRFAQDGDVPVVVLNARRDHASGTGSPVNRVAAAEAAARTEREARERADRALKDALATVHDLQTRQGHIELARHEAVEAARKSAAELESLRQALAEHQQELDAAQAALQASEAKARASQTALAAEQKLRQAAETALEDALAARDLAETRQREAMADKAVPPRKRATPGARKRAGSSAAPAKVRASAKPRKTAAAKSTKSAGLRKSATAAGRKRRTAAPAARKATATRRKTAAAPVRTTLRKSTAGSRKPGRNPRRKPTPRRR